MTTSPPAPVVLVIDDESQLRRFLRASLHAHGFHLVESDSGAAGLVAAAQQGPDVVILDLGLPDLDGVEVARRIREKSAVPIIVLSARGGEMQKVEALDAGADDYLTKPFGIQELLARIRAALRRSARSASTAPDGTFSSGTLRVDLDTRRVFVRDQEVHLTPIEYKLLATLVQHAGRVVTHRQLLESVWGPNAVERTHYLRVHITHLRRKLESDPVRQEIIATEAGVGYRLRVEDEPQPSPSGGGR